MEESEKKQWIKIGTIFGVLVLLIGLAYAWITLTIQGQKEHVLRVGSLELVLDESSEAINIEKAIPISDSEGQALTGFTFTLENTGVLDSDYTIYLDDTELHEGEIRLTDSNIKFSLEKNGTVGTPTILSEIGENPNRVLDTGSLKRQEKNTYTLRIWLADTSSGDIAGQVMRVKLRVEAIQSQSKSGTESLLAKVNSEDLDYNTATSEQQKEMWTFSHEPGTQQAGWTSEELTDYRYIGKDPNNYIIFNDEVWRIIGVFTTEDTNGKKAKRMKLIRNESLGKMTWNSNGINDWKQASLNTYFNSGEYYQSLSNGAKEKIDSVKYYLGGTTDYSSSEMVPNTLYVNERGTQVYSGRSTSWVGEVGLMYPSDYGYATSGGSTIERTSCLTKGLDGWSQQNDCKNNDWLYNSNIKQWLMTPDYNSDKNVFYIFTTGSVMSMSGLVNYSDSEPCPVIYLKPDTKLEGTGTSIDPYKIVS